MAARGGRRPPGDLPETGRVGVIDIGSNSVRLVAYVGDRRFPVPFFNEKVACGLGRHLAVTGRLHPDGVDLALAALERFAALAERMRLKRLDVVATAAVREAVDGPMFIALARDRSGLDLRVLDGAEEARLAAMGVHSAFPDAEGLVGDLGGGSLELVAVSGGRSGDYVTLPLGPLRLMDVAEPNAREAIQATIDSVLNDVPWLDAQAGRTFYAVGGAWRSLAQVHMAQNGYPLRVLHHYTIPRSRARTVAQLLAGLGKDSLTRIGGISRRRTETLPYAAMVLDRLLKRMRPSQVVFSAFGLREGVLYDQLPADERDLDPLIEGARDIGQQRGRFPEHGAEMQAFVEPLFIEDPPALRRLRLVACCLSDIAWRSHPDYRALHAFFEVMHAPLVGIDHGARVLVAAAVHARYGGGDGLPDVAAYLNLLDEPTRTHGVRLGAALRLGQTLSGGTAGVLPAARLVRNGDVLTLVLDPAARALAGDVVQRRLASLARLVGCQARIAVAGEGDGQGVSEPADACPEGEG